MAIMTEKHLKEVCNIYNKTEREHGFVRIYVILVNGLEVLNVYVICFAESILSQYNNNYN